MAKIGPTIQGNVFIIPVGGKIEFQNSNRIEVFSVDENGNIRHRGKIGRTART